MLNVKKICRELEEALNVDEVDPVEIMTLIEIFVDKVNTRRVSPLQKRLFLLTVVDAFQRHKKVLAMIGWDLAVQLMKFIKRDNIDIHGNLGHGPIATAVILGFNAIALEGLPKETLDTGCELLSSLNYKEEVAKYELDGAEAEVEKAFEEDEDDEYETDTDDEHGGATDLPNPAVYYDRVPGDFFIGFKVYVLFEMISASYKRISTLYPSKYLALIVSATEEMIRHTAPSIQDPNLLLRRIHNFCLSYVPREVPKDVLSKVGTDEEGALTQEQLDKIVKEENKAQVLLLRRLCTFSIANCVQGINMASELKYFMDVSNQTYENAEFYRAVFELQSRFYNLELSYDVDIKEEFLNLVKESRRIYQALPKDETITSKEARDAISDVAFKLSYSYNVQKLVHQKHVCQAPEGILALSAVHYLEYNEHLVQKLPLDDAIFLYLNFATRSFYSPLFENLNVIGAARYWLWVSVTNYTCSELREQLCQISDYLVKTMFKTLLLKTCQESAVMWRMVSFTLLTRLLCLAKQDLAFEFIEETLQDFPYPHGKSAVLVTLSDLIMKTKKDKSLAQSKETSKKDTDADDLADKMQNLKINESSFIDLTEERMRVISDLAHKAIDIASQPERKQTDVNLVINYGDFFKSVKTKWDKDLLVEFETELAAAYEGLMKKEIPKEDKS